MLEEVSNEVSEEQVDSTSEEANTEVDLDSLEESETIEENAEVGAEESEQERKFEMVVDGEKLELTLEEMTILAQKGKGSAKRFQEAAQLRKEAAAEKAAVQAALQGDPQAIFDMKIKSGLMNSDEMNKWIIDQAIKLYEESELSPEEIERKKLQEELDRYRKQEEEDKKAKEQEAYQIEVEKYKQHYAAKFSDAIKSGGLENDPYAVRRIALAIQDSLDENGVPMMDIEDAISYVKNEEHSSYKDFLSNLDVDQIQKILGKDKLDKLRTKELKKLANPESKPSNPLAKKSSKPKAAKISASEFFKNL